MLRKLIKYDLLADYKKYFAVYIAMVASSVMMLFFDKMTSWISNNLFIEVMSAVSAMVFFVLCIAVGVMLLVLSTIRFYKNVMRDEGYLTHTLPVHTWQIIASKFISVYIWFFASVIVAGICSGIAFGEPFWLFKLISSFNEYFSAGIQTGFNDAAGDLILISDEEEWQLFVGMLKYYAVFMLLSPFTAMSNIYFSFALGNLFNKSKLGMSVLMFFLLQFAESVLGALSSMFFSPKFIAEATKYGENIPSSLIMDYFFDIMTAALILSVILSIGFTIAAERIFAKKLNLE